MMLFIEHGVQLLIKLKFGLVHVALAMDTVDIARRVLVIFV